MARAGLHCQKGLISLGLIRFNILGAWADLGGWWKVFGLLSFWGGRGVAVFEPSQLVHLPEFYLVASITMCLCSFECVFMGV